MENLKAQPIRVDQQNFCCVCESKLHGREDKAFCNYKCKNLYHADKRRKRNCGYIKQTSNRLNRNYDILCYLAGPNVEKFCVNRLELSRLGFQFNIVSGYDYNKFGLKLNVYEFSWYMNKNQNVIIYRNKEQNDVSPYVYKRWERKMKHKESMT